MKMNVFIDGTWLFKICAAEKMFANRTERPEDSFRLDFNKLNIFLQSKVQNLYSDGSIEIGECFLFTSVITIDESKIDPNWEIGFIRSNSYARDSFIKAAENAGYNTNGVQRFPLKFWMIEALDRNNKNSRYQEKMVDTALVAKLVEHTITHSEDVQVVIAGDLDILPGIKIVIPDYSRKLVLATSHPQQFDPAQQIASYALVDFDFEHEPIYLENEVEKIMSGQYVYRCSNHSCNRVFSRHKPVPKKGNPLCYNCKLQREAHIGNRVSIK